MIDNSFNKKSFFKSKGIYIVAALCILATGAGVLCALSFETPKKNNETELFEPTTIDLRIEYSEIDSPANNPVKNQPDNRETETNSVPTTKAHQNMPYKGSFALPMGTDITKDYSYSKLVKNKTTADWRTHDGIDFGGSYQNNVVAISDGKIKRVYKDPLYGNTVIINHGCGIVAKYCGLDEKSLPKEGTEIKKYDVIGKLGEVPIEKADGSHLHFEIEVNGKNEDPLKVMNKLGK